MRMITYQVKIQTNSSLFGRMDKPLRTDCHKLEQPAALNHLLRTCKHVQFERFTKQLDNVINKLRHPALGRTQQFNEVCNPVAFAAVALLHEYGNPSGQKEPQRLQENNSLRAQAASTANEKKTLESTRGVAQLKTSFGPRFRFSRFHTKCCMAKL